MAAQLPLLTDLLKAHEYLRGKGMAFDLVVLNAHGTTYRMDLQDAVQQMVESGPEQAWIDRPGGVFLRRTDLMPGRGSAAAARDRARGDGRRRRRAQPAAGPPAGHLRAAARTRSASGAPEPCAGDRAGAAERATPDLESFNGLGGFADRRARVRHPPASQRRRDSARRPGSNVVAHPTFGFAASDLGTGFTWSGNSHDNRLTPWRNDPVSDPQGEAVFIRDEESGRVWSATPLPAGGGQPYTVRHGQGYSVYEHARDGIESRLRVYVAAAEPVKVFQIALRNTSSRRRQVSVTLYAEWVLGENRARTGLHIVTRREPTTGALLASNAFRDAFADRVAFLDLFGGDDADAHRRPDRIHRPQRHRSAPRRRSSAYGLSDRTGAAIDPCGAVQVRVTLEPSQEQTRDRPARRSRRRGERVVARAAQPRRRRESPPRSTTCRASGDRCSARCR